VEKQQRERGKTKDPETIEISAVFRKPVRLAEDAAFRGFPIKRPPLAHIVVVVVVAVVVVVVVVVVAAASSSVIGDFAVVAFDAVFSKILGWSRHLSMPALERSAIDRKFSGWATGIRPRVSDSLDNSASRDASLCSVVY